jgi:ankyrin repeat protein
MSEVKHKGYRLRRCAAMLVLTGLAPISGCISQEGFFKAVRDGDARTVKTMCHDNPSLVSIEDGAGRTGLNIAIYCNKPEVVQVLVAAGTDMYHESVQLAMPLSDAAYFGKIEIVKILLAAGCDVNRQPQHAWAQGDGTALHNAVGGDKSAIVKLLLENKANVNARAKFLDGATPLHLAAVRDGSNPECLEIVRVLLDHGADVNAKCDDGKTPLTLALETPIANKEGKPIIDLLVAHGAKQ